jgi:hypothetical protein
MLGSITGSRLKLKAKENIVKDKAILNGTVTIKGKDIMMVLKGFK